MTDLVFISENIYHLKREYGITITVGSRVTTSNLKTGIKSTVVDEFVIRRAIALPINWRQMYARTLDGSRKQGYVELGSRDILIDTKDVPSGKKVPEINGYIKIDGKSTDITKTEDYKYGIIVSVKQIPGLS